MEMEINLTGKINHKYNHYVYKRKNLKILIIDDDELVSTLLQEFLSIRGHNVEIVNEGSRGITKNSMKNYDIIFIDYHLDNDISPGVVKNNLDEENILNGANVSEFINTMNENHKSIVFGYTGDSTKNAINKFKNSGADGIIFKPVEPELIDRLMFNIESSLDFDKNSICKAFKSMKNNIIIF